MDREEEAMERLKRSMIKKCETPPAPHIFNSKEKSIQQVYKCAIQSRGDNNKSVLKLSEKIRTVVEQLAKFLKERELKGVARIFFKNVRLLLELILCKC
jgi:hypothetical protein